MVEFALCICEFRDFFLFSIRVKVYTIFSRFDFHLANTKIKD